MWACVTCEHVWRVSMCDVSMCDVSMWHVSMWREHVWRVSMWCEHVWREHVWRVGMCDMSMCDVGMWREHVWRVSMCDMRACVTWVCVTWACVTWACVTCEHVWHESMWHEHVWHENMCLILHQNVLLWQTSCIYDITSFPGSSLAFVTMFSCHVLTEKLREWSYIFMRLTGHSLVTLYWFKPVPTNHPRKYFQDISDIHYGK